MTKFSEENMDKAMSFTMDALDTFEYFIDSKFKPNAAATSKAKLGLVFAAIAIGKAKMLNDPEVDLAIANVGAAADHFIAADIL